MIKNIIFDIGQVLVSWEPLKKLEEWYGPERGRAVYEATLGTDFWRDNIDRGYLTEFDIYDRCRGEHPELEETIRDLQGRWYGIFAPITATQELGKRLHQAGYRLYYLSNFPEHGFLDVQKNNAIFREMEGGLVSYEPHLCKPDPAFYQLLLERFGLKAEESVFADDLPVNIQAARELGIHGHLFTTAEAFEQELRQVRGLSF